MAIKPPVKKPVVADLIQRVVLIIKENQCFDNYVGTFSGANGASLAPTGVGNSRV